MDCFKVVEQVQDNMYSFRTITKVLCSKSENLFPEYEYYLPKNLNEFPQILKYEMDKVTRPNFGFIFGFLTLKHTERFIQCDWQGAKKFVILQGIGMPASRKAPIYFGSCNESTNLMLYGWKNTHMEASFHILPAGTIFLRSFRPKTIIRTYTKVGESWLSA